MSIDRLKLYQSTMSKIAVQSRANMGEADQKTMEISFPAVTVLVGGALLSGKVTDPDTYNVFMRRQMAEAKANSEVATGDSGIADALMAFFPRDSVFTEEEIASDELLEIGNLYLLDVRLAERGQITRLPAFAIKFESIDGWSFGELS